MSTRNVFAHTLPPVKADASRVLRTTVGLRPFRPDGFVVRTERIGEKVVVHDYGHGGSGMSLCWGTALMAVESALYVLGPEAAVIGCGVIGLATARLLQRRGITPTIYAAAEPPHTTSNVSGAFWSPFGLVDDSRLTPEIDRQISAAGRAAYAEFEILANNAAYGVKRMPMYYLDSEPVPMTLEEKIMPEVFGGEALRPGEHPFGDRYARVVNAMSIEPAKFMNALVKDFLGAGGQLRKREVASRDDIASLPESVVFNCSGLGSRVLAGDDELIPMKGQLTLLEPQPEINYMIGVPKKRLYMVPRADAIVLGTSQVRNNWTLDADKAETARVLSGIKALWE